MIQPWLNSPYAKSESFKIRDYLLPNIIAFKSALNKELQEKVEEINLMRSNSTSSFINSTTILVAIRIDADENDMRGHTETLRDVLNYHMDKIGLSVRLCVYNLAWLDLTSSYLFWRDLRTNSLLVWSKHGNKDNFITAKSVIDNINEESISHSIQLERAYENESLRQFITDVPKMDWSNVQAAIHEPPTNYDNLPDCYYAIVATHARIWCTEYFIHMPDWVVETLNTYLPCKQPSGHQLEYENFC